jgi:hypothetical protein
MEEARPIPGEYEGRPEPYPYDPEYPDRPESPYDDDPERPKLLLLVCLLSVFASSATQ